MIYLCKMIHEYCKFPAINIYFDFKGIYFGKIIAKANTKNTHFGLVKASAIAYCRGEFCSLVK